VAPFLPLALRIVPVACALHCSRRRIAHSATAAFFAAVATAVVACQSAGVGRAYMALDANGDRKRTQFFTDTQTVWCDVEYSSGRTDLTIDVRIRATELWDDAVQARVPVDAVLSTGEIAGMQGTGTIAGFQWVLLQPGGGPAPSGTVPFPVGNFVCDVTLDGQPVASLPFDVDFPACPVPPVVTGATCSGWVQEGSVGPDSVGDPCSCSGGVWSC
jgi:hypothetical protein